MLPALSLRAKVGLLLLGFLLMGLADYLWIRHL